MELSCKDNVSSGKVFSSRRVGITPTTTHVAMTVPVILPERHGFCVCVRVGRPKSPPKLGVTHGFCDSSEQIYYKLKNAFSNSFGLDLLSLSCWILLILIIKTANFLILITKHSWRRWNIYIEEICLIFRWSMEDLLWTEIGSKSLGPTSSTWSRRWLPQSCMDIKRGSPGAQKEFLFTY